MATHADIPKALRKCHHVAFACFFVGLLLWLADPSPIMYLVSFSLLGILWFGAVVWMWRTRNILTLIVALFVFSLYLVPEQVFKLHGQVQELQGVLLAISILALLLYVFRDAVIRIARLKPSTGPGAVQADDAASHAVKPPTTYDANLGAAHKCSSGHREEILGSDRCGCFYCLETFGCSEIKEWIDERDGVGTTALCPRCGIDSVIGSRSGYALTPEFLREMQNYFFRDS